MENLEKLQEYIDKADRILVLTGAGISPVPAFLISAVREAVYMITCSPTTSPTPKQFSNWITSKPIQNLSFD